MGNVVCGRFGIPQSQTLFASVERWMWWVCDGADPIRGDKQQGEFFRGNALFGGGEKPESGPNYLSSLIHVDLQATCSMVTCSGLGSIVQEMITQNPVLHFAFRVQLGETLDSYLTSTGVFRGRFICGITENDQESDDRGGYVGILLERVKSLACAY